MKAKRYTHKRKPAEYRQEYPHRVALDLSHTPTAEFSRRRDELAAEMLGARFGLAIDGAWLIFNLIWLFAVKHGEPIDGWTCLWSGLVGASMAATLCDWSNLCKIKRELEGSER